MADILTDRRMAVVANPVSSRAGRWDSQIDDIDSERVDIPSHPDERYTWDALYGNLQPDDVLLVRGGDGMFNRVLNGLMQPEATEQGLDSVAILPVPEGNANDLANMLNGRHALQRIMSEGRVVGLHPLDIRMRDASTEAQRYAAAYFSVGGTAAAAEAVDGLKYARNRLARTKAVRKLLEVAVTVDRVGGAPPLTLTDATTGGQTTLSDRLLVRGDRIAKYGRPHGKLDGPYEDVQTFPHNNLQAICAMIAMQRGRLQGEMSDRTAYTVTSHDGNPIPVQLDGEVRRIDSGTAVSVACALRPYLTITTKL